MLPGTVRRVPDWCHPAPSHASTAWADAPTCYLTSAKSGEPPGSTRSVMAPLLTRGMTMAAPTAREGQKAPHGSRGSTLGKGRGTLATCRKPWNAAD